MPRKIAWVIVLIVLTVIASAYFLRPPIPNGQAHSGAFPLKSSSPGWRTYKNTAFGYEVHYPDTLSVEPLDRYSYSTPITELEQIDMTSHAPNNKSYVGIIDWVARGYAGLSAEEKQRLAQYQEYLRLDLKTFAEKERLYSLQEPNPNVRNRQVGELQETTFASSTAYTFTLSGENVRAVGSAPPKGGVYRYIFFENPNGDKFTVWYMEDDPVSQQIVDSFRFTDTATSTNAGGDPVSTRF